MFGASRAMADHYFDKTALTLVGEDRPVLVVAPDPDEDENPPIGQVWVRNIGALALAGPSGPLGSPGTRPRARLSDTPGEGSGPLRHTTVTLCWLNACKAS